MRRYHGFFADSARWGRFRFRDDDIVISTPSKCGTTWMQHIVGSLVLDRPVLGAPISTLSPWLDMLVRTDDVFHYSDLWTDLAGEMRRVADALGVTIHRSRWPELVGGATLSSMRSRSEHTAPDAQLELWRDPSRFFHSGGHRDWAALLSDSDVDHFGERLAALTRDATPWVLTGRAGLPA